MKKVLAIVLALALVLGMVACGGSTPAEPEKVGTLGVVMPNATHGFMAESIAHAQAEAEAIAAEKGLTVNFLTSAESSEQNNQIDQLIADGVDCIVLWPHNGDEVRSSAQAVMDAGIPLIIYDRLINDFVPTVEIMGDNETIGKMTGEYFNKFFATELAAGKVNILEFKGDNSTVPEQRSKGFASTASANINIVQQFSTDWQRAKAMEQLETWFASSSVADIEALQAVFTHDDEVVLGVLDAINNYDGPAKLNIKLVSGVGGRVENLDTFVPWAEKGVMQVTYAFSPSMVRDAVKLGADIVLDGATPTGLILIPTVEIDNSNEQEFRTNEIFVTRYSLTVK